MKYLCLIVCLLSPLIFHGQTILMSDGSAVQCSGKFYDSGGPAGPYSNSEDLVFTICPETAEEVVRVNFIEFFTENVEDGAQDILSVYDGPDVSSPLIRAVAGNNNPGQFTGSLPGGCLTFRFTSTFTTTASGWNADVSCVIPCQSIESQLDSASPAPDAEGKIKVCPGEEITLNGSGIFGTDGAGATYQWDLDDGRTIDGTTATFSYDTPGVYLVNLNIRDSNTTIDPDGCNNTNLINQVIQVSSEPVFTGTQAADQEICLGNSTTITGVVTPTLVVADCTPPVSGTTSLPDTPGEQYSTEVIVECFGNGQTLESASQIVNICMSIEHSFAADLDIILVSPDGRTAELFDGDASEFVEIFLGNPNGADDGVPGIGETYCFSLNASDILIDAPLVTSGSPPGDAYAPGTYLPSGSLDNLVGSPLNGEWQLVIRDNFVLDDGTIFEWSIEFDDSLVPEELSFTPEFTADNQTWDADPSIIATNGSEITVQPSTVGQHCYTFRAVNDFGCEYTEQVCIDVLPEVLVTTPSEYVECDTFEANDGFTEFDLASKDNEILGGQNPNDYNVSYYETFNDADQGVNPLPNSYVNTTNPQTIYARVDYTVSPSAVCYSTTELNLVVNLSPEVTLPESVRICADTNGSEVLEDPILDTGLSTMQYTFEWSLNGVVIPSETSPSLVATENGTYTVEVTDISNGCSNFASSDVVASSPPLLTAEVISEPFADRNVIEATAGGSGDYEFSLNNGPFQLSGRFSNVPPGINVVTARDINGCGEMSISLTVLNYPRVFTPNSDGINDTWNVEGIANQPDALISIFDRFGKLLKQISPSGRGWDGTFNGNPLPSTDYWFSIDFNEPNTGIKRNFTSHFSLRR